MDIGLLATNMTEEQEVEISLQMEQNKPEVEKFCETFDMQLTDVEQNTDDYAGMEPAYFFDKGIGGYSIDAIKLSLYGPQE